MKAYRRESGIVKGGLVVLASVLSLGLVGNPAGPFAEVAPRGPERADAHLALAPPVAPIPATAVSEHWTTYLASAPLPRDAELPAPRVEALPRAEPFPSLRDDPALLRHPLSTAFFLGDLMDGVLGIPEKMLDGLADSLAVLRPEEDGSVWARILTFQTAAPRPGLFSLFFETAMDREQRFFSGIAEEDLDTAEGASDQRYLRQKQRKIVWEAVRRTYTEKYKLNAEDRLRDEAFSIHRWSEMDFVVLPPLLAGYLYYRGIDKRFSAGSAWLDVSVEAVHDILHDEESRGALSVMWVPKTFPVGLIVSVGFDEGDTALDFIGIGTGIDIVQSALARREDRGFRAR